MDGIPPLGYKVNKDKRYEIDEPNANVVRKIFDMYLNGHLMSEIIRYLNEKGIKTSQGNEFNKCSIRTILFYKVQDIMQKNQKAPARAKAKTEYLLTTKLFCGNCKEMMVRNMWNIIQRKHT